MITLSLAARNLLRNRRRSLATVLALAIGATAVLLFGGYSADIRYTLLTDYVQNGGHLQIQHKDFYLFGNGNPTAYGLSNYDSLIKAIKADPELKDEIRTVSPTLQFGGLAGNYAAGVSRPVMGVGYVAEDVARMRQWNEFRLPQINGPYKLVNAPEDAAIVGIGVARVLLLCEQLEVPHCPRPQVGQVKSADRAAALPADIAELAADEPAGKLLKDAPSAAKAQIELLATQPRGTPNVASLKVIAAEDQGYKELDEVTVKLQLGQAQRLVYGRGDLRATSIMVQLEHTASIPQVTQRLRSLLDKTLPGHSLDVLNFEQINPFYGETISLFNTIFGFIFVLIGGIVLFTVSNTMMAAVMERTNEIGTVRAVGLRQSGIRKLFVTEGFLLGCVGAAVGVAVALLLAALINALNLTWLPPGSSTPLPLTVRVFGELAMMTGTAIGLVLIATLSAWLPSWRAAKLSIVDALRHT
ncbi:MAG: FtsX-like permease family protein [Rubrivivax sp.]